MRRNRGSNESSAQVAFTNFCHSEYPRLIGALSIYTSNHAVAEELAQEAFARAWVHWGRIGGKSGPTSWLYKVAFNLATSWWRRRRAEERAQSRLASTASDNIEHPEIESLVDLRDSLKELRPKARAALVLRYYLDLSYAEVGDLLGIPESTAKSIVRRALDRLKAKHEVNRREVARVEHGR